MNIQYLSPKAGVYLPLVDVEVAVGKKKAKEESPAELLRKLTELFRSSSKDFERAAKMTQDLAESLKETNEKLSKNKRK